MTVLAGATYILAPSSKIELALDWKYSLFYPLPAICLLNFMNNMEI